MRVRIMLEDRRDYVPELCATGGKYLYRTFYTRQSEENWQVEYWCSADMSYCPHSGEFKECDERCEYKYISYWEMLNRLREEANPDVVGKVQVQFFRAGPWVTLRTFLVRDELPTDEEAFLRMVLVWSHIYLDTLAKYVSTD